MTYTLHGPKMRLDKDNSLVRMWRASSEVWPGGMAVATKATMCNDVLTNLASTTGHTQYITLTVRFPELRDLDAFICAYSHELWSSNLVYVSADDQDGDLATDTWTDVTAAIAGTPVRGVSTYDEYFETDVVDVSALTEFKGIRSIGFYFGGRWSGKAFYGCHLFGKPAAGANDDQLQFWHPTLDQALTPADLEYGLIERSSSYDKTFRVKNLSPTLTAQTVSLDIVAGEGGSLSSHGEYTFDLDGGGFAAGPLALGNLAPGAISPVVTLRRTVGAADELGKSRFHLFAEPTAWA